MPRLLHHISARYPSAGLPPQRSRACAWFSIFLRTIFAQSWFLRGFEMASWCSTISACLECAPIGSDRPLGIWFDPQKRIPIPSSLTCPMSDAVIKTCGLSITMTQISDNGILSRTLSSWRSLMTRHLSWTQRNLGVPIVTVNSIGGSVSRYLVRYGRGLYVCRQLIDNVIAELAGFIHRCIIFGSLFL